MDFLQCVSLEHIAGFASHTHIVISSHSKILTYVPGQINLVTFPTLSDKALLYSVAQFSHIFVFFVLGSFLAVFHSPRFI